MTGYLDGAIIGLGLTAGRAVAAVAITVGMIALLLRALTAIDRAFAVDDEPDWWPEFEAQLADYLADRDERRA